LDPEIARVLREVDVNSHRVFFWANEFGRQTGERFDVELGLLRSSAATADRFEVDGAYFLVAKVAPLMAKRGKGTIVNLSTMAAD